MSFVYPRPTKNYIDSIMPTLVPISVLTENETFIKYSDEKERLRILAQNNISDNIINNESSEKSQHIHEQQAEAKRDD